MSKLPDPVQVAREHGLREYPRPAPRGDIRFSCPFCDTEDRGFHLYVSSARQTYHCFRCGLSGGVADMIARLENRSVQAVLDDYLQPAEDKPVRRRIHPVLRLSGEQWRAMGFPGKPSQELWARDKKYARRVLNWAWQEWKEYRRFVVKRAVRWMAAEKRIGGNWEERAKRLAADMGRQYAVPDLEKVAWRWMSLAERGKSVPSWVGEAIQEGEQLVPRRAWSFSRLRLFERCPWAYYEKYVLGTPEPESESQRFGREVHEAVAAVLTGDEPHPFTSSEALQLALKARKIMGFVPVEAVESEFRVPLTESDDLRGFIDAIFRVGESVQLVDWKTSWSTSEYNPRSNPQLALYAYAYLSEYGEMPEFAAFVFLRTGKMARARIGKEEMDRALTWARSVASEAIACEERVASGEAPENAFQARFGAVCKGCPFVDRCPATKAIIG